MWSLFCNVVCTCYTSRCATLLLDMSVPSDSIVSPSLHVQWGYSPLMRAAQKGHGGVSRFLLARRSSVQEQNNVRWPNGVLSNVVCWSLCPTWDRRMIILDDQAYQTNDSSLPIVTSMQRFAHHRLCQAYEARDRHTSCLRNEAVSVLTRTLK